MLRDKTPALSKSFQAQIGSAIRFDPLTIRDLETARFHARVGEYKKAVKTYSRFLYAEGMAPIVLSDLTYPKEFAWILFHSKDQAEMKRFLLWAGKFDVSIDTQFLQFDPETADAFRERERHLRSKLHSGPDGLEAHWKLIRFYGDEFLDPHREFVELTLYRRRLTGIDNPGGLHFWWRYALAMMETGQAPRLQEDFIKLFLPQMEQLPEDENGVRSLLAWQVTKTQFRMNKPADAQWLAHVEALAGTSRPPTGMDKLSRATLAWNRFLLYARNGDPSRSDEVLVESADAYTDLPSKLTRKMQLIYEKFQHQD